MKPFRSIAWRLQFWYAVLLTCVSVAFVVTAYTGQRSLLFGGTDSELDRRIAILSRILRAPPPGRGALRNPPDPDDALPPPPSERENDGVSEPRPKQLPLAEEASYGDEWYYYFSEPAHPGGRFSANAPKGLIPPTRADLGPRGPSHRQRGVDREAFVILPAGHVILVGRFMAPELRRLHFFGAVLGGIGAGLVVLGLAIGNLLVRRSLRSIDDIGATASKIATGDLSQRINASDTDNELGQLVRTLNGTFARLETAFAQQVRFTSDAAHELRTPVSVLLAQTQAALASESVSGEARDALAACHRSAQRMRAVIESLLVLARHDAGQPGGDRGAVDLSIRADEVLQHLSPLARERSIQIVADCSPVTVEADPTQMDRVLMNLVTNAIVHQGPGGRVIVTVRQAQAEAIVEVADSGKGIDPQHLPRIFERFYRADASRSRVSGGTGLGLAIVKAIVESHGGTVSASNIPGGGALFSVKIPAIVSP